MTDTQKIFALSGKENYTEPDPLEQVRWPINPNTWLQRRRRELARKEGVANEHI